MAKIKTKHLLAIAILAVGATLLLFLPAQNDWVYAWQDKLFSPGHVYYKHMTDQGEKITCQDCHGFGKILNNNSCTECHTRQRFLENSPFLADAHRIFNKQDRCLRCHIEHGGAYTFITPVILNPQQHRKLPYKTTKCLNCHEKTGQKAHRSLATDKCQDCHKNYSWSSDFNHRKYLSRADSPEKMLALCQKCHIPDHHYNPVINNESLTGCIFCHDYWAKRKERKSIPFPDELFKNIKTDPKKFKFTYFRVNK